ncbi:MAG: glycosyltransferase [Dehalococcoidia bacterium]|nr:glycosyltransferase [Dehalococcoidia bacterium]
MKVLFLTQFYPPEVGATQSRMHHFARHLAEKGHRVTVVTELPNHPKGIIFPGYGGRPFRRTREDGLDVIRLWVYTSPRKSPLRRILFYFTYMINAVIACLLLARGRYDVIFATSPPLPVLVSAYLVSRFKRCRGPPSASR